MFRRQENTPTTAFIIIISKFNFQYHIVLFAGSTTVTLRD